MADLVRPRRWLLGFLVLHQALTAYALAPALTLPQAACWRLAYLGGAVPGQVCLVAPDSGTADEGPDAATDHCRDFFAAQKATRLRPSPPISRLLLPAVDEGLNPECRSIGSTLRRAPTGSTSPHARSRGAWSCCWRC